MPNTEDVIGQQEVLDKMLQGNLTELVDDRIQPTISVAYAVGQWYGLRRLELPSWDAGYVKNLPRLTHLKIKSTHYRNTLYQRGMYSLMHLALADQDGPTTGRTDPLNQTLIAEGLGAVYVKSSAVSAFRADSNYGQYRIEPLENYPASLDTIDDTWEEIIEACGDGTYDAKYQVGDTKELTISGNYALMTLVAKDADVLDSDGTTTVPTTWLSLPLPLKMTYQINTDGSVEARNAKWEDSYLRERLESIVLSRIENTAVRNAIKTVRKTYRYRLYNDSTKYMGSCGDRLWIPSCRELLPAGHADADTYETEGPHYTVTSQLANSPSPYSKWYDGSTSYPDAWTRTMYGYNPNNNGYGTFHRFQITSGGPAVGSVDPGSYGKPLVIGFCI